MLSVCIVVPVRNPAKYWQRWLAGITKQVPPVPVVIIDSSSQDGTLFTGLPAGSKVVRIAASDFKHGATRNLALQHLPEGTDLVVLMTQDALLHDKEAITKLTSAFADSSVACAYGRQLPHADATPFARHARLFNYPQVSTLQSLALKDRNGLKTCFFSNSFAAYRLSDLHAIGGFPNDVIMGEDMYVAAKLLLSGKRSAYMAQAVVYHSHNYTLTEEFRRYFDTGVFHARNSWLINEFGTANGEGFRFLSSELSYLWCHARSWIPFAVLRNMAKWSGYRMGRMEAFLPRWLKRRCSLHQAFWLQESGRT